MALVKVINTLNHAVGVYIPELNFKRTWAKRGAIIKIEKDKLEESLRKIEKLESYIKSL